MQNNLNINLDQLVHQIHVICPHLASNDDQADRNLRRKLEEQLIIKTPEVELEHLDLKCIIMKVKQSLSEFQRRIDESVAQQQLRRTTRIRKSVHQDPAVVKFFNTEQKLEQNCSPETTIKTDTSCANSKCCHKVSELSDLVQVESLPVSASTNLLTIFVPSILQEKLHSCKYKISIDLNRLDLTKQILDLNVEQQVNSNLPDIDKKEIGIRPIAVEVDKVDNDDSGHKVTYEVKGNFESQNTIELVNTQNIGNIEDDTKVEIKPSSDITEEPTTAFDATVSIEADTKLPTPPGGKKRGPKRKEPKPPSNNPPKKRGRKLGSKNKVKKEKSDLAKYVEMFACNADSPSGVSQIVTSTTQNWDVLPEQSGQIAYFMNGEWTLSAPLSGERQLVSTTSCPTNIDETAGGGQETYIPFEDFVNFIENPSLDAGNNVIARVLDGSVDTAQDSMNSQETDVLSLCVRVPQTDKDTRNIDSIQQESSLSEAVDKKDEISCFENNTNIVHCTNNNTETCTNDEVLDLSKQNNASMNVDVLDLTQKKGDDTTSLLKIESSSPGEGDIANKNVIFSINRSIPSFRNMEGDLFCTPQQKENCEKKVVFSIASLRPSTSTHKSLRSPEEDSQADSAIETERKDTLLSSRDSSIDVTDYSKSTSTPLKETTNTEVIKGMSLLEIEKDIDDSLLDFDNCMDDDLLSLAPSSCFNTPTEDRYANSNFLDIDESDAKPCNNNNSVPAPRSHLELNAPKNNEKDLNTPLKNFKIPRMKSVNDESSEELMPAKATTNKISKPSNLESPSNSTVSSCHSGTGPKLLIPSGHSNIKSDGSVIVKSSEIVSTREISKLFGSLCYGFLADNCFQVDCKFSHQLLDLGFIANSLSLLRPVVLHSAYRFIWRHHKLFGFYFPIFCEEYARRNMRRKLSNLINDCVIQPNCLPYLRNVYSNLIGTGLNRINACRFVLSRVKERSHVAIDILLEIIIQSNAAIFCAVIEQFLNVNGYKFRMKDINDLATVCLHSGNSELTTILIKCLISVDPAEFVTMRSPELIQLLEMVKNGDIGGL